MKANCAKSIKLLAQNLVKSEINFNVDKTY
jgi:hypothetical protein